MVFCNAVLQVGITSIQNVTILILIDGFLQYKNQRRQQNHQKSHNPYFNRWFSAIMNIVIFKQSEKKSQSLF